MLEKIEKYFQDVIAPQAQILDDDTEALKNALKILGDRNLLGLKISQQWGGEEWDDQKFYQYQMMIAQYSGALAFLQTQHQSAGKTILSSENEALKQEYLPAMAKGKKLVGIGYSQLRKIDKPMMVAKDTKNGFELTGIVPWITGYNLFDEFIIGAILPNKKAIYALIPFKNITQDKGGSLQLSKIMKLAVMECTNTVSANVTKLLVKPEKILLICDLKDFQEKGKTNILHHSFFPLGCSKAAIEVIKNIAQEKQISFLEKTINKLTTKLNIITEDIFKALPPANYTFEDRLKLRTKAIQLSMKSSQACVIASSGAGNSKLHPAQRIYREALLFAVSGQTREIMEESLNNFL